MQGDGTLNNVTTNWFSEFLDQDDDPELWQVALNHILTEFEEEPSVLVEVGRCSHWLRPHQARWTAGGGFAWPTGYGSGTGGYSISALPQFDWSVVLGWTGSNWEPMKRRSIRHSLRVTIPSRTKRHQQAAIHTLWHTGKEKEVVFYGFRRREQGWIWTASTKLK
jgi:hypothetical protein